MSGGMLDVEQPLLLHRQQPWFSLGVLGATKPYTTGRADQSRACQRK